MAKKKETDWREVDKAAFVKLLQTPGMTDVEFRASLKNLPQTPDSYPPEASNLGRK